MNSTIDAKSVIDISSQCTGGTDPVVAGATKWIQAFYDPSSCTVRGSIYINAGTSGTFGVVAIYTLPVGYRPAQSVNFAGSGRNPSASQPYQGRVNADGAIVQAITLSCIEFSGTFEFKVQ